jgi:hypothetical protein
MQPRLRITNGTMLETFSPGYIQQFQDYSKAASFLEL